MMGGLGGEGRTSEYHLRASVGMPYCFAFSSRSSTRDEKIASKSFRWCSLEDIVCGGWVFEGIECGRGLLWSRC